MYIWQQEVFPIIKIKRSALSPVYQICISSFKPETAGRFLAGYSLIPVESEPPPSKRKFCAMETHIPSLSSAAAVGLLSLCKTDETYRH